MTIPKITAAYTIRINSIISHHILVIVYYPKLVSTFSILPVL